MHEDIRCSCCGRDVPQPIIETIAGQFLAPWGMCCDCWRHIGKVLRRAVIAARIAFRGSPHLDEALAFYRSWRLAESEARSRAAHFARAA